MQIKSVEGNLSIFLKSIQFTKCTTVFDTEKAIYESAKFSIFSVSMKVSTYNTKMTIKDFPDLI